jgi:hypothetical protein
MIFSARKKISSQFLFVALTLALAYSGGMSEGFSIVRLFRLFKKNTPAQVFQSLISMSQKPPSVILL